MSEGLTELERRLAFWAACLAMLGFGVSGTVVGAVLPWLMERYAIGPVAAGSLLTLLNLGVLLGSLVFGPVVDRYGYRAMLVGCSLLVAASLYGLATAPSLGWLRVAVLCAGFGGGVVNGGASALVSDISTVGRGARLSLLGIFFGIGALGVPLSLGVLLQHFSHPTLLVGMTLVLLPSIVLTTIIRLPVPKRAQGFARREALALLRDPVLLIMGLMLLLQSGMEATLGGWTASFFQRQHGIAGERAVLYLALFWLGLMLARLALGTAMRHLSAGTALPRSLGVALLGSLLMTLAPDPRLAALGTLTLGLGLGGVFPLLLGLVGDRYATLSGTAFSAVFTMALIGGMILPFLTGLLGEWFGLRAALGLVPLSIGSSLLLFVGLRRAAPALRG